ncbi:MAG: hypothetical protein ACRCTI_09900 [Beijerinckiaceae bacterium]
MRRALLAVALATAASLPAAAADDSRMTADEVRELLSGNTLTGRYNNGNPYSEFHTPEGIVYGHNNRKPVERGCWEMRGDEACYYYAEDRQRGPFCWSFRRIGVVGYQATLRDKEHIFIIAVLQKGNPHGHSHNGKPWSCEPLQSQLLTPRDGRTRYASR